MSACCRTLKPWVVEHVHAGTAGQQLMERGQVWFADFPTVFPVVVAVGTGQGQVRRRHATAVQRIQIVACVRCLADGHHVAAQRGSVEVDGFAVEIHGRFRVGVFFGQKDVIAGPTHVGLLRAIGELGACAALGARGGLVAQVIRVTHQVRLGLEQGGHRVAIVALDGFFQGVHGVTPPRAACTTWGSLSESTPLKAFFSWSRWARNVANSCSSSGDGLGSQAPRGLNP